MDWPRDMPFPIFYKKWQVEKARGSGMEIITKERGLGDLTWESMNKLRKEAQKDPRWDEASFRYAREKSVSLQAMAIEEAMFEYECRTFLLSPNLIDALRRTKTRDTPENLIKIPFDWIYIDISSNPIEVSNPNNFCAESIRGIFTPSQNSQTHAYLCQRRGLDPDHTLYGLFVEHAPGDTDGPRGPLANWSCGAMVWKSEGGIYTEITEEVTLRQPNGEKRIRKTGAMEKEVWNLWINSILYINSVNADIREEYLHQHLIPRLKKKSGKAKRDLKQAIRSDGRVFRVGHYIHIPQISDGERKSHQGGKINVRFEVRGHWHLYWVGSNRLGNRRQQLKWLMPYWKGPETADVVHSTYVVKKG